MMKIVARQETLGINRKNADFFMGCSGDDAKW
jgi:hypothetical protein